MKKQLLFSALFVCCAFFMKAQSRGSVPTPSICMVTVDAHSVNNFIYWDKTTLSNVDSFIVYRETSPSVYTRIGAVSDDSLSQFEDTARSIGPANGDPNVASYRYKLQVRDIFGNYGSLSPYHNTIFIVNDGFGGFSWAIPYGIEGASNPVTNYVLLCDTANVDVWGPVSSVPPTDTTANDPGFATHGSIANWRVKTNWSIVCDPTRATVNTTRSNIKHAQLTATGIAAQQLDNKVVVYPNPANEQVTIGLAPDVKNAVIEIENMLGQVVYSETVSATGMTGVKRQIDLAGYGKGMYMVRVKSGGMQSVKKLVIH